MLGVYKVNLIAAGHGPRFTKAELVQQGRQDEAQAIMDAADDDDEIIDLTELESSGGSGDETDAAGSGGGSKKKKKKKKGATYGPPRKPHIWPGTPVSHLYPEITEGDVVPDVSLPDFKLCEKDNLDDIKATKWKATTFLHPDYGFTKESEGRVASLHTLEFDYKLFLQRAQHKKAPIAFRVSRVIRLYKQTCGLVNVQGIEYGEGWQGW